MDEGLIVVAPDSFKGSLGSPEVGRLIADTLSDRLGAAWTVRSFPMADGGEGTVDAVASATDAERVTTTVTGPRESQVEADWVRVTLPDADEPIAVIEMAQASGLELLEEHQKNPMKTTTYGTGELIEAAVQQGCEQVVLGIGGSATVDGGMGLAQALGYRFLDEDGNELKGRGENTGRVATVEDNVAPAVKECRFQVACDVDNPLLGDSGAARVYGPQKGASEEQVEELERNLTHWADVVEETRNCSTRDREGAGAAGGLGFGMISLFDAELTPGAPLIMRVTGLDQQLEEADVVVTGEGRIDRQTQHGKTPYAVAREAARHDPSFVVGVAGSLGEGYRQCLDLFDWLMALPVEPVALEESLQRAEEMLEERSLDLSHLIRRWSSC
jgi:glycerate kinase